MGALRAGSGHRPRTSVINYIRLKIINNIYFHGRKPLFEYEGESYILPEELTSENTYYKEINNETHSLYYSIYNKNSTNCFVLYEFMFSSFSHFEDIIISYYVPTYIKPHKKHEISPITVVQSKTGGIINIDRDKYNLDPDDLSRIYGKTCTLYFAKAKNLSSDFIAYKNRRNEEESSEYEYEEEE